MSSREQILAALRAQLLERVALPPLRGTWIEYPDLLAQFGVALTRAAGSLVLAAAGDPRQAVSELAVVKESARCCSFVEDVPGNMATPRDPHGFQEIDVVVVAAAFGVAENGAVWLDEQAAPVRAGLFLAQHLVVLLGRSSLVHHMHQAYERLGSSVGKTGYGCFISGPSKTADIEQALVVGAHGPRSLTIIVH